MHTRVERLPDGSDWVAILHGPIVLAKPDGTRTMNGLFADDGRMAHVAHGRWFRWTRSLLLLTTAKELPDMLFPMLRPDHCTFGSRTWSSRTTPDGLPLVPFFTCTNGAIRCTGS